MPSSISVTSAAIGDRSDRVSVTCAKSGWPLRVSITAATPSCRPTLRLSRCATSWVRITREFRPTRDSTVRSTLRSNDWASSTITNASCSERPRMCVSGSTSSMSRSTISSTTSRDTSAPRVSKTASAHGFIFSAAEPGRYPSSWPPTAYSGRNTITLRCCRRSITASIPAHRASADLPVPARPPRERIPTSSSSSRSIAIRCSALRPCTPKTSWSPRTRRRCLSTVTRASAEPREECSTTPVWQSSGPTSWPVRSTSARSTRSFCQSAAICASLRWISVIPVQPESMASSARYSSAARPQADALIRSGRSLETSVTSLPSSARFLATARMRVSLSPSRKPAGSVAVSTWLSSTRREPPASPTGTGWSNRPCCTRMSSSIRRALRAKKPSSGWWRLASSSVITTTGRTTSCSAKRTIARGSDSRTEVSSTYVRVTGAPSGASAPLWPPHVVSTRYGVGPVDRPEGRDPALLLERRAIPRVLAQDRPDGVGDLPPAAVPDGDVHVHARDAGRADLRGAQGVGGRLRQQVEGADHLQVPLSAGGEVPDGVRDDAEQLGDLLGRARQVVRGEHPERDDLDADLLRPPQQLGDLVGARPVAGGRIGTDGARPAPVAVEDHADVPGNVLPRQGTGEATLVHAVQQVRQAHAESSRVGSCRGHGTATSAPPGPAHRPAAEPARAEIDDSGSGRREVPVGGNLRCRRYSTGSPDEDPPESKERDDDERRADDPAAEDHRVPDQRDQAEAARMDPRRDGSPGGRRIDRADRACADDVGPRVGDRLRSERRPALRGERRLPPGALVAEGHGGAAPAGPHQHLPDHRGVVHPAGRAAARLAEQAQPTGHRVGGGIGRSAGAGVLARRPAMVLRADLPRAGLGGRVVPAGVLADRKPLDRLADRRRWPGLHGRRGGLRHQTAQPEPALVRLPRDLPCLL